MPDHRQLDDQEAAQRRRAWLEERHASARELVVVLLRQVPEAEVARALDQLPAGGPATPGPPARPRRRPPAAPGRPAGRDATRRARTVRRHANADVTTATPSRP